MKIYRQGIFLIFLLLTKIGLNAQVTEREAVTDFRLHQEEYHTVPANMFFSGQLNLKGILSTKNELPFWMYHNQRGRISEQTNFSGWINGRVIYPLGENSRMEAGGGLLFDEERDNLQLDELYVDFQNTWLTAVVGRKQRQDLYNGLSSGNENILWSLNTRPLPGLQLGTIKPIFLFSDRGLGFEASWNEYLMEEDRIVSNARLHHKNFHLVYRTGNQFEFKVGLQHFVQWGGIHSNPERGQQPQGFRDYLRIITGQEGLDEEFELNENALGNHLGSYEIFLRKGFKDYSVELLYNSIFEDGSGRRLGNTPDGRYGIFVKANGPRRLINSIMYEFYFTHHQSHTSSGVHKIDNYFYNGVYRSGWTYESRVLGAPFFSYDAENGRPINNKFTAHHLGIGGVFSGNGKPLPYKLLVSYSLNEGTYGRRFDPKQEALYVFYDMRVVQSFMDMNLQLGVDYDSYTSPNYGIGLDLRYHL